MQVSSYGIYLGFTGSLTSMIVEGLEQELPVNKGRQYWTCCQTNILVKGVVLLYHDGCESECLWLLLSHQSFHWLGMMSFTLRASWMERVSCLSHQCRLLPWSMEWCRSHLFSLPMVVEDSPLSPLIWWWVQTCRPLLFSLLRICLIGSLVPLKNYKGLSQLWWPQVVACWEGLYVLVLLQQRQ